MLNLTCASAAELADSDAPRAVFAYEDKGILGARHLAASARKQLLEAAKAEGWKGTRADCAAVTLTEAGRPRRYLVCGLGPAKDFSPDALRRAAAAAAAYARARWPRLAVFAAGFPGPAAEGLLLSSYRFQDYKKAETAKLEEAILCADTPALKRSMESAVERASVFSGSVAFARDLVNRGPSDKTPQALAELSTTLAEGGVSVKVLTKGRIEELGMGAFLGVARGSAAEPTFVHLVYKPKAPAKRKLGLVGKGITFDSGGLSLKPPASMETMKMDMAGAACVLAVFKALPALAPRVEIHGFCAFTYNLPGPDALKPGDVVRAGDGKTIEVLNTDAEGRLILADALVYACRQQLDAVIDLATLTGAVVTALGSKVSGVMGNDRALLRRLLSASEKSQEPLCELPLYPDYRENLKSSIADLQNIGKPRGEAGSIIGGLFLQEFVGRTPWAHLDIAGTAWSDHAGPYGSQGATGTPVRTLLELVAAL